jgi:hypothetical protein
MLRITADVNGHAIGYVYIHNVGQDPDDPEVWRYHAACWTPERPKDSILGMEAIYHVRSEGWLKLALIVMSFIRERVHGYGGLK